MYVDGEEKADDPSLLTLYPSAPNPLNPASTISFTLVNAVPVTATVYDVIGRKAAIRSLITP